MPVQAVCRGYFYALPKRAEASTDCLQDVEDLPTTAYVVPWIDEEDPLNKSTIDVFVHPKVGQLARMSTEQSLYVCTDEQDQAKCLCKLQPRERSGRLGMVGSLVQHLPGTLATAAADWQLSLEQQCPAPWVDDVLVGLAAAWALAICIVSCEALLKVRTELASTPAQEAAGALGVIVPTPWTHVARALRSVGFVLLGQTLQRSTVAVLVQTSLSSSERIVWTITGLSAVVSFTAVWWFHRIACRTMLVDSLLTQGIVVSFQPSKVLPGTIVGGIFLYGGLVVLDSLALSARTVNLWSPNCEHQFVARSCEYEQFDGVRQAPGFHPGQPCRAVLVSDQRYSGRGGVEIGLVCAFPELSMLAAAARLRLSRREHPLQYLERSNEVSCAVRSKAFAKQGGAEQSAQSLFAAYMVVMPPHPGCACDRPSDLWVPTESGTCQGRFGGYPGLVRPPELLWRVAASFGLVHGSRSQT